MTEREFPQPTTGFPVCNPIFLRKIIRACLIQMNNGVATGDFAVGGDLSVAGDVNVGGTIVAGDVEITQDGITIGGVPITPVTPAAVPGSAEYWQSGAQPGSIAAGQPFTFTTIAVAPTVASGITKADAQVTNLGGGATGTVITLARTGQYDVSFSAVPAADGGIQLALGPAQNSLVPLPYTMEGRTVGATQIQGSHIVDVTNANSCLCVIAATGNTSALQSADAGTANTASTSVRIRGPF